MTNKTKEIIKKNTLDIRGKEYLTVAGRLQLLQEDVKTYRIDTEVLSHNPVVVKAMLLIYDGHEIVKTTTGISAANPSKAIEKMTPYEVAETSAVGRALGFAGYGLIDQVASADEMVKATTQEKPLTTSHVAMMSDKDKADIDESVDGSGEPLPWEEKFCPMHPDARMMKKEGKYGEFWTHGEQLPDGTWRNCHGKGFR